MPAFLREIDGRRSLSAVGCCWLKVKLQRRRPQQKRSAFKLLCRVVLPYRELCLFFIRKIHSLTCNSKNKKPPQRHSAPSWHNNGMALVTCHSRLLTNFLFVSLESQYLIIQLTHRYSGTVAILRQGRFLPKIVQRIGGF